MILRRWIAWVHPRVAVVAHDLGMVLVAWGLAKTLRLALEPMTAMQTWRADELLIVLGMQGLVFWWTGLYRGLWRFASLPDLWNIARAVVYGAAIIGVALFLYDRLDNVPRSVLLVYPALLFVLLGAPRILYRYWKDSRLDFYQRGERKRVLVLGAGRAGEMLVREILRVGQYTPVGFVDDNRLLRGARVHGVPVLGDLDRLPEVAREVAADMLLIAMPSISAAAMRRVVELCERTELPFRTVPRLQDVVSGRSAFNELKEVAIDDLLGRDPVELDWTAIRQGLSGKRVLVTGGGGSIGSELCRQAARLGASTLSIIDSCEYNLYRIERELRGEFPDLDLHLVLGDVTDPSTVEQCFRRRRPEVVFHAAAYKHVPLLQGQVREAFRNNVFGTECVADAATRFDAAIMVLISTDKAVNPVSVMGATKRVAELYCECLSRQSVTRFITVRFGNVLDSAGSVVPLFREQIARGGPVTVTHPEITRYFMTIPEACQLIFQAAVLGRGGEVFVLDMGEPVKIRYLAEQMIRLAGKVPERDIAIVYTGLREGEKLFEELFHAGETLADTQHAKIFLAQHRPAQGELVRSSLVRARRLVRDYRERELMEVLLELVPELAGAEAKRTVVPLPAQHRPGA